MFCQRSVDQDRVFDLNTISLMEIPRCKKSNHKIIKSYKDKIMRLDWSERRLAHALRVLLYVLRCCLHTTFLHFFVKCQVLFKQFFKTILLFMYKKYF